MSSVKETAVELRPNNPDAIPQRQIGIDLLKGFAIVAVVLHHVDNPRFDAVTRRTLDAVMPAVDWAVYAFFFAAGYLHARSRSRSQSAVTFIRHKAFRLLVPYVVLATTYAVLAQAVQCSLGSAMTHASAFGVKLLAVASGNPIYGEQMYFFPLLFIVATVFQLLWTTGGRSTQPGWVAGLAGLLVLTLTFGLRRKLATTGWSVDMAAAGLLQYAVGFVAGSPGGRDQGRAWIVLASIVCGVAAVVWDWRFAMVPLPWAAFALLSRVRSPGPAWRAVTVVGVASGTVFAYHTPFLLQTLLVALYRLHVPAAWDIIMSVVAAIALCVTLHFSLGVSATVRWARI